MHTTILRKVGGSVMLAVPRAVLEVLRLRAGTKVGLIVERDRLVIAEQKRPHYTLNELLAQCHPKARTTKDEWLQGGPVAGS